MATKKQSHFCTTRTFRCVEQKTYFFHQNEAQSQLYRLRNANMTKNTLFAVFRQKSERCVFGLPNGPTSVSRISMVQLTAGGSPFRRNYRLQSIGELFHCFASLTLVFRTLPQLLGDFHQLNSFALLRVLGELEGHARCLSLKCCKQVSIKD